MRTITGPHNTARIDRMVREFREIDEAEDRRIRERNEAVYLDGIRTWFRKTEPVAEQK